MTILATSFDIDIYVIIIKSGVASLQVFIKKGGNFHERIDMERETY